MPVLAPTHPGRREDETMPSWFSDPINLARVAQQMHDADCQAREIVRMLWNPALYTAEWEHVNGREHEAGKCLLCEDAEYDAAPVTEIWEHVDRVAGGMDAVVEIGGES